MLVTSLLQFHALFKTLSQGPKAASGGQATSPHTLHPPNREKPATQHASFPEANEGLINQRP